jgi:hypothetical protein
MLMDVEDQYYDLENTEKKMSAQKESRESLSGLTNVQTDGKHFVISDARMFTSPWSPSFVHGSDSLFALGDTAAKILKPGERIAEMGKISWKKPITRNLRYTVFDHVLLVGQNRSNTHLEGELTTTKGRRLQFFAEEIPDTYISIHQSDTNSLATISLDRSPRSCRRSAGEVVYKLRNPALELCQELDLDQPAQIATLVEMITWAAVDANETMAVGRQPLRLMGRVSGLVLPDRYEKVFQGPGTLRFKIHDDQTVRGNSGMEITPFEYEFSYMGKPGKGMLASTESEACANRHLDKAYNGR